MNRNQLVEAVAAETGLSGADAGRAVAAAIETITNVVAKGEAVTLAGFGTFERRHRAARTGRNPQTGEALEIAETHSPAFKPAQAFKRQVADS